MNRIKQLILCAVVCILLLVGTGCTGAEPYIAGVVTGAAGTIELIKQTEGEALQVLADIQEGKAALEAVKAQQAAELAELIAGGLQIVEGAKGLDFSDTETWIALIMTALGTGIGVDKFKDRKKA